MSRHTTLRIGGPAERLVCPDSERQLLTAWQSSAGNWSCPVLLIGRGSNLLVSDQGLRGVVLCPRAETRRDHLHRRGTLPAPAGLTLARAANFAAEQGYAGLEFAHGIPGTVGGAIYMNAGAYGGEMKDIITRVEVLDSDGTVRWLPADECGFSYRAQPGSPRAGSGSCRRRCSSHRAAAGRSMRSWTGLGLPAGRSSRWNTHRRKRVQAPARGNSAGCGAH